MKKRIALSSARYLLLFFNLILANKAEASHAVGAQLTYECLGGNQYLFTYIFYRDCGGIAAPTSMTVNYTSSCSPGGSFVLIPTPFSPTQIPPTCPGGVTTCNGGIYKGIEEWVYTGTVTLTVACADWTFAATECCRSDAITTVTDATSYNLFVFALLNNLSGLCNNSPEFLVQPIQSICVGHSFCFDNRVWEGDGDSLSFQLITPLSASGTPISYDFPYSSTAPILSSPPALFNSFTGQFCLQPVQAEVSPYALLVSEYRNGVLIGQIERDIQIEVVVCPNNQPSISGLNGSSAFSDTVCVGNTYNYSIYSSDADASQLTLLNWDGALPGAQFSTTGGTRDTAQLTWTPVDSNVIASPYNFTISVRDNSCPYIGILVSAYTLFVLDSSSSYCLLNSISNNNLPEAVQVYSESNGEQYRLEWTSQKSFSRARIYNVSGNLVREFSVEGQVSYLLKFQNFKSGIYYICLDGDEHWRKSLYKH